ncbi:DUF7701 domain-containing protein [Microbispora bryophytorum]|uniref:DUF7701 domain-containing protein n=1 Tax=Microbispora bryophytorum TaxID=1460882 RepID=A0A8H9GY76_9ACTN|nr:hypothetical protein [Microbispora bryophytorum]MBD3135105.1 hypothetical protein [Microbispora bryophytorum]TQS08667.1 hypothetical protein FLX07_05280 [Microbispora bryophytorum]GGO10634.1 hypothetical protein GCM10011574_27390 [Microbispora bryophytorum]
MTYLDEIARRIRDNLPAEARPPAGANLLFLLYAVLVKVKGQATTLEDVHDAWAAWMQTVNPVHAALVPFSELAPMVQDEDLPYLRAIHRTAAQLNNPTSRSAGSTDT